MWTDLPIKVFSEHSYINKPAWELLQGHSPGWCQQEKYRHNHCKLYWRLFYCQEEYWQETKLYGQIMFLYYYDMFIWEAYTCFHLSSIYFSVLQQSYNLRQTITSSVFRTTTRNAIYFVFKTSIRMSTEIHRITGVKLTATISKQKRHIYSLKRDKPTKSHRK